MPAYYCEGGTKKKMSLLQSWSRKMRMVSLPGMPGKKTLKSNQKMSESLTEEGNPGYSDVMHS